MERVGNPEGSLKDPPEIRTQVNGFKDRCDNHYTSGSFNLYQLKKLCLRFVF